MPYEHKTQPVLSRRQFALRLLTHGAAAFSLLLLSLGAGLLGYHYLAGLDWIDSFLNASMILAGMGPVDPLNSDSAKIFASVYAIFSGTIFLVGAGIIMTPVAHRIIHILQLEEEGAS